jgi:GTP-binding protein
MVDGAARGDGTVRGRPAHAGPRASSLAPRPSADDPLVVRRLEFLGGMAAAAGWRPQTALPEVAFAGRSNVGKSSLINRLVRRKKLARVSNAPGRTREINFFQVNDDFILVDLPGYGYARVSKAQRREWRPLIEGFMKGSDNLRGIVLLLDARRAPSADDLQMLDFLAQLGAPTLVAMTKVDKLPRTRVPQRVDELATATALDPEQIIPFSAVTGEGRDELAEAILSLVREPSWRGT